MFISRAGLQPQPVSTERRGLQSTGRTSRCIDLVPVFGVYVLIFGSSVAARTLFSCDFEQDGFCGMTTSGTYDWARFAMSPNYGRSSGPEPSYTGAYHIRLNNLFHRRAKLAILTTDPLDYEGPVCVSFAYGARIMDSWSLSVNTTDPSDTIFHTDDYVGDRAFTFVQFNATINDGSVISFEGRTGTDQRGHLALDTINVETGRCIADTDECATDQHGCEQYCVNTDGSYHCACDEGYTIYPRAHTCRDIDECEKYGEYACEDGCVNTVGSYICTCNTAGYEVGEDGSSCVDIDECLHEGQCQHSCTNAEGTFSCSCDEGYTLDPDGYSCIDLDECALDRHRCAQRCTNTLGSYLCSCDPDFSLRDDGFTCEGCIDQYRQIIEPSQAFTSTCPVVEELMGVDLDQCFLGACEGATVNMVTYRSPMCILRLCQPGEHKLTPSVGVLGWDIYVRLHDQSNLGNQESFSLWRILAGVAVGILARLVN